MSNPFRLAKGAWGWVLQKDSSPAFFFLCAANAAIEERRSLQRVRERTEGAVPQGGLEGVQPGAYVGQFVLPNPPRRLTDVEFTLHLQVIKSNSFFFKKK